jgi:hypothetical protein
MTPRFSSTFLKKWLEKYVTSGAKVYIDQMPDTGRVIFITMQPGPGLELEGLLDNPAFNIQCRGAERDYEDAEAIALEVDSIILEYGHLGFEMSDVVVQMMDRTGGAPQQINIADRASRFAFSCNYYAKAFSNIGGYK